MEQKQLLERIVLNPKIKEDILACLLYASETLEDTTFMPLVEAV